LIYAWVNDQQTLRTYGSRSDAYAVFAAMLKNGNPPDDWQSLLATCNDVHALESIFKKAAG
jgi:toxin YhaV